MNTPSTFGDWQDAFDEFKRLSPDVQRVIRTHTSDLLVKEGAQEVGSSDINHKMYELYNLNDRSWHAVVLELFRRFQ